MSGEARRPEQDEEIGTATRPRSTVAGLRLAVLLWLSLFCVVLAVFLSAGVAEIVAGFTGIVLPLWALLAIIVSVSSVRGLCAQRMPPSSGDAAESSESRAEGLTPSELQSPRASGKRSFGSDDDGASFATRASKTAGIEVEPGECASAVGDPRVAEEFGVGRPIDQLISGVSRSFQGVHGAGEEGVSISTTMLEVDESGRTTGGSWAATIRGQAGHHAEHSGRPRILPLISITSISREDGERAPTVKTFAAEPAIDLDPGGSRAALQDPFAAFRQPDDPDS